jgi:signal transduction histidine kinase
LSEQTDSLEVPLKPGRIGVIAVFLAIAAVVLRTFGMEANRPLLTWYLGLELVYTVLFSLVIWKYTIPGWLMHLYLAFQCILVLFMLSLRPQFDFVVLLFALLTYQISLSFSGREMWIWVGILGILIGGPLIYYLGILRGLALSLTTIAASIVIPVYIKLNHGIEQAQVNSQSLVSELQATNQQLKLYSDQVEELAAVQERNRLARELHDTVSQQIFSISLTTRSAQLLLEKDPQRVPEQLLCLQGMTGEALRQLRSLITQLRSPQSF